MGVFEVGSVCLKTAGRDAGKKCVIVKNVDKNFVEVACAGRKKNRKCNISHLTPLNLSVDVKDKDELSKALK